LKVNGTGLAGEESEAFLKLGREKSPPALTGYFIPKRTCVVKKWKPQHVHRTSSHKEEVPRNGGEKGTSRKQRKDDTTEGKNNEKVEVGCRVLQIDVGED